MNEQVISGMPAPTPALQPVTLEAKTEPLEIDLQRTALMVIDMQNAFAAKGGWHDLWGGHLSEALKIIDVIKKVTKAARAKGINVIYTAHEYSADFRETGGPSSPNWREPTLAMCRERPEHADKGCMRGTWGQQIVDELKPEKGDIVLPKNRYSAFAGTNLAMILKTFDIKYLVFTGIATNCCVESTLRAAFFLEYLPIIISDACAPAGPPSIHEATLYNVKHLFGWVATSENFIKALK